MAKVTERNPKTGPAVSDDVDIDLARRRPSGTVLVRARCTDDYGAKETTRRRPDATLGQRCPAAVALETGRNPYAPLEILSADQVEAIHHTSLRILGELGIELMSPRARELMRAFGAEIDDATGTVRIDAAVVERALALTPASFTLTPRNPLHSVTLGGDHLAFGLVAGPPNVHDCRRGRRAGNYDGLLRLHPARPVLQCRAPDRQPGLRAGGVAGRHASSRHVSREPRVFRPRLSLHGHRCGPRPRWHRDDGHLPRALARGDGRESRRHHDHLGQQPAPLR